MLNQYRSSSSHTINRQHLFFVSRKKVPQHIKDYYDSSYGLRVIDETKIPSLFSEIDIVCDRIFTDVKDSKQLLDQVISGKTKYADSYLKRRESFAYILATISCTGHRVDQTEIVDLLTKIIRKKIEFTESFGAWEQYEDLAVWLIHLGCVMDLKGTPLEETYLETISRSFTTMSKDRIKGKSWFAYQEWEREWGQLTFKNRAMVRNYISEMAISGDFDSFIEI